MSNGLYELLGEILQDQINANVFETQWQRSRVQARDRSQRSGVLDNTPFEEIRNQDHDQMRSRHSGSTQTGDT